MTNSFHNRAGWAESSHRLARLGRRCTYLLILCWLAVLSTLSTPAEAQTGRTTSANRRSAVIEDRVNRLTKGLDLTQAQQATVRRILERRQQEALRIRNTPSLSGAARIDQFRALQEHTVQQIRAVLDDEQKKKYDPLAVRRLHQGPQPNVENWLNTATPH